MRDRAVVGLSILVFSSFVVCFVGCHGGRDKPAAPAASTASVSTEAVLLIGDLDGNGLPGVADAIAMLRMVVGLQPVDLFADVDGSGSVGVGDAIAMLRCVVGLDPWPIDVIPEPVDEQGGTVMTSDGNVTLDIPAGALAAETDISIFPQAVRPAADGLVPGTCYEFGPEGTQFSHPAEVVISYSEASLPAGCEEDSLVLNKVVGNAWEPVPGSQVNVADDNVSAPLSSFSLYAIIGEVPAGYQLADLEGDWRFQMLVSGDSPQWTGWGRGTLSINATGNLQWTHIERSDGNPTLPPASPFGLAPDGTMTWPAQPGRAMHGTLSPDRNCFVWTMTDGGNGYLLGIAYRQGTGFAGADFVGRWLMHALITGDAPQYIGWCYGAMNVDAGGSMTWEYHIRSSGNNSLPAPVTASLAADGTISMPSLLANYRAGGSMAPDKQLYTISFIDGGGGWLMGLEQRPAQGCTTAQLAGRWSMHAIVGGDWPQYTGWAHGIAGIDAAGNVQWESMSRSNGDNSLDSDFTIAVQPDGTFTTNHPGAQAHGAFTPSNGLASMTMNDGGGGYGLAVMQKIDQ